MDQVEILSESVIKVENIKQEPDDQSEEEACNFKEGDMVYPVKRELKEEENDEEELKPPIRVFVDPAEVPGGGVNKEDEDPLALDAEFVCCKSEGSAGGEDDIEGNVDSKTRPGGAVEASSDCSKGNDLTLGVKPNQRIARKKSSAKNYSRFSERNSASEDELSVCGETQSEEFAHECSDCHKSFKWKNHLVMHMRIHSGERPYKCSDCEKSFALRSTLVTHMRIHSGERPYECYLCQKSFALTSTLVSHMRVHRGKHFYDCTVCHRRFASKIYLERHMLIHNGEPSYLLFSMP
ncbi:hypothetical protein R5R35_010846 [Gryllus longicercus]|uniref:C2H2-type domain-containing protein n=1 Tax=Gryllus longicercus TaxID=2509291 RepID=A0AAN9ZDZ3_9ORTH